MGYGGERVGAGSDVAPTMGVDGEEGYLNQIRVIGMVMLNIRSWHGRRGNVFGNVWRRNWAYP